jgi:carboxyl-terminal processing protease
MTPETSRYLGEVLTFMEQHALMREKVDWHTLRCEALSLASSAQTTAQTYPAIERTVQSLGNHHSFFLTPDEASLFGQGAAQRQDFLAVYPQGVIVRIVPGSPVEQAGVRVGDIIETINGMSMAALGMETFRTHVQAPIVSLTLKQAGQEHLLRVTLHVTASRLALLPQGRRLPHDIGYLELPTVIGRRTIAKAYAVRAQQIIREVDQAATCGWIVDVRCDTGGEGWPMLAGVGPILSEGECLWLVFPEGKAIGTYRHGQVCLGEWAETMVDEPYHLQRPAPPVAVLTSQLTRSAGEFVALAFRQRPHTRSFGEPAAGLPAANQRHQFSDGAVLYLTVALGADRTGNVYDSALVPDQPVKADWTQLGTERDPVLQAALGWLSQQEVADEP